ncbi:MAG: hypothetical protein J6T13_07530 [Bacteroidales bacterium]|nr:hypothetical protein [Bacteroidales bacterium]
MNRWKFLIVFLVMSFSSYAQQFRVVEDTLRINASDFISPISEFEMKWAAKYHGYYFCIFKNTQVYDHWLWKNRLLVISEDGNEIREVSLPKDFQRNYYGDLFTRHDTLFLRPYHLRGEQDGYFFDMSDWQWEPVEVVSNVIYEDDQYSVAFVDIGEWGEYTWFIDKTASHLDVLQNTQEVSTDIWESSSSITIKPSYPGVKEYFSQHLMPRGLSRIIKKDNVYYFIRVSKVDTLISLEGKTQLCEKGFTYEDASADEHVFLQNLYHSGGLEVNPVPTFFQFTGRYDEGNWWGKKTYDTVFSDAFLTNGNLYYLINSKKKTIIAQLEDGKLIEKFDLGHPYRFLRWYDCFRGENPAPNQCFLQFEENKNSYGVLEIQDTLIHICHIVHNQDSLPHIGTDNIEPLLQYLLNHLDHLTLSQTDSVEKSLQATCQGEFRDLANLYYPDDYQTGEYERYSYYTVADPKETLSVYYCVHKSDSMVRGAFFEWIKTNVYNSSEHSSGSIDDVGKKHSQVRQILTRLTGKEPVKSDGKSKYLLWSYHNITIKLYEDGRMVMYLTKE